MNDPQDAAALWRGQDAEGGLLMTHQIRQMANHLSRRNEVARAGAALVLVLGAPLALWQWTHRIGPISAVAALLTAAGLLVIAVYAWRQTRPLPALSTAAECLGFLKLRKARELRTARGGWLFVGLPLIVALAVQLASLVAEGAADPAKMAPLALAAGAWLIVMLLMTRAHSRKLRAELAELDELGR